MAIRVQIRRDTASKWQSANPILLAGELGIELDTSKWKIGNGIDPWSSRPYVTQGSKGDPGKAFVYEDFTQAQLNELKSGVITMAQSEVDTLITSTNITIDDLVANVSSSIDALNQTNATVNQAEQARETAEVGRAAAETERSNLYTGYRDSLNELQLNKADKTEVDSKLLNKANKTVIQNKIITFEVFEGQPRLRIREA